MKEVQREIQTISYKTMYIATDGTEFENRDECIKYEASALGTMRNRISKLIAYDSRDTKEDAWTLFGGCDDHDVVAVKMNNEEDFKTVVQFFLLECPWYNNEDRKELRDSRIAVIEKAYNTGDLMIFGLNCDGDYYFINSRQGIIDNLKSFDNEEKEESK